MPQESRGLKRPHAGRYRYAGTKISHISKDAKVRPLGLLFTTKISDMQARVKEFNRKKHTAPRSRSLVAGAPATPATDTSSVSPKLADKAAAKLVPVSSPVSASKLLPVPLARQVIKAMYLLYQYKSTDTDAEGGSHPTSR